MNNPPGDRGAVDSTVWRTCLGCGSKKQKYELQRFVGVDGVLVSDPEQNLPGRGVYCCQSVKCLKKFAGRKSRLVRALRQELTDWRAITNMLEEFSEQPGGAGS